MIPPLQDHPAKTSQSFRLKFLCVLCLYLCGFAPLREVFAVKYFYNRQICLQLTMILLTFLIHRLRRFPQIFLDLGLITSVLFFWINMARSLLIPKAVFTAETPQYDFPNLPQYHLPELRGRRGKQRTQRLIFLLFSVDPAEKAGLAGKRETTNSSPTGYK